MNKVVKTVLLVTHPTRPEAISTANELTKLLTDKQINVFATIKTDGANNFKATDQIDLAVVLGGDGTMLRAAEIFRGK